MSNYSMPCRDIDALQPVAQKACRLFLQECQKAGLKVGISQTLRTAEYQNSLFAQGRTVRGKIVTKCDGYKNKSNHQGGMAFDYFQNIPNHLWDESFFDKAAKIGQSLGLDMGHYWKDFSDSPHCDVPRNWKAPQQAPKQQIKEEEDEVKKTISVEVNGKDMNMDVIVSGGFTYIKTRELEKTGKIKVSNKGAKPVLTI